MGRNTAGVRLVNLKGEDRLVALEVVTSDDLLLEAKNLAVELKRDEGRSADRNETAGADDAEDVEEFDEAEDVDEADDTDVDEEDDA